MQSKQLKLSDIAIGQGHGEQGVLKKMLGPPDFNWGHHGKEEELKVVSNILEGMRFGGGNVSYSRSHDSLPSRRTHVTKLDRKNHPQATLGDVLWRHHGVIGGEPGTHLFNSYIIAREDGKNTLYALNHNDGDQDSYAGHGGFGGYKLAVAIPLDGNNLIIEDAGHRVIGVKIFDASIPSNKAEVKITMELGLGVDYVERSFVNDSKCHSIPSSRKGKLNHTPVVTRVQSLPDSIQKKGYLFAEYGGVDAYEFLKTFKPGLTTGQKIDFALMCVQEVEFLHRMRISHGDIKPENFLVGSKEGKINVRPTDFGSSKKHSLDGFRSVFADAGTPEYLPIHPQLKTFTRRQIDVFALLRFMLFPRQFTSISLDGGPNNKNIMGDNDYKHCIFHPDDFSNHSELKSFNELKHFLDNTCDRPCDASELSLSKLKDLLYKAQFEAELVEKFGQESAFAISKSDYLEMDPGSVQALESIVGADSYQWFVEKITDYNLRPLFDEHGALGGVDAFLVKFGEAASAQSISGPPVQGSLLQIYHSHLEKVNTLFKIINQQIPTLAQTVRKNGWLSSWG